METITDKDDPQVVIPAKTLREIAPALADIDWWDKNILTGYDQAPSTVDDLAGRGLIINSYFRQIGMQVWAEYKKGLENE